MTAQFSADDHPRNPDGTFANSAKTDPGQLDLGDAGPYDTAPRSDTDLFDHEPTFADAQQVAQNPSASFVAEVSSRLGHTPAPDAEIAARKIWRAHAMSEFFAEGADAAAAAIDEEDTHPSQPGQGALDMINVGDYRDEDGLDYAAVAEAASDAWSYEAFSSWRHAVDANNDRKLRGLTR